MALVDVLRGLTKGVAESAGNEDAVRDLTLQQQQARQNQQQNQDLQLKTQLAPLTQASAGYQKQLVDLTDPNTGLPYAGKEDQYHAAKNSLADVIGKTRMILHPPPPEDPHGLGYLAHRATDVLHITNDAAQRAREAQSQRVNDYYQNLNDSATNQANMLAAANGGNPLNPSQQTQAAQVHAQIAPKAATEKAASITPLMKLYKMQDGTFKYLDSKKPDELPPGAQPATISATNPKQPNKDDKFIAIQQKKGLGQTLSPEDKAYEGAYLLYNRVSKIEPGVARAAAFASNRYVPVMDPNNPEQVVLMRAGEAAKAGAGTPASIGFQTDKAITRYMTSGQGGTNINYFNTATDHLRTLREAGDALQNGDIQLFNKLSNRYATATGSPAPTNFETVKSAVAGELSKTFKGTGATDKEIGEINQTINQAQSPQQIQGAVDYYTKLMGGKIDALREQYMQGKQGMPDFRPPVGPKTMQLRGMTSGEAPAATKGTVSLTKARSLPQFKGKSDAEITAAAKAIGYEVRP